MIEHYLTQINHYLQAHAYIGILFAFLVSLAESLPLVGTIIPGSITMSIIGILVGQGMISLDATLFWASIGALAGDTVGFFVGKHYNERLRLIWPFKRYPQWLTVGEAFFRKHGGKSILIGRFVGPVRSSVPLIAGLLKMSWPRFFLAAIPSAILWAIAYLLPGVLIGTVSLQLPRHVTTTFILTGLAIIVLVWLVFGAIQRSFSYLISMVNDAIDRLWQWLYLHHSSRFLLRLITNHRIPTDHHQLTMLLLAFLSLCCFFVLVIVVAILGPATNFNEPLFYFLESLRLPNADKFFTIITILGDPKVIISIVLLFIAALLIKKLWRPALHLTALTLTAGCLTFVLKKLIYSPRPASFLVFDHSSSFPSGHISLSLPALGFIAFLTSQQIPKKWHWIPYTIATILIILIGYSRLYLGAHWLEDALASLFLGFSILLSVIISYQRYPPKAFGNLKWLIFLILAITFPWAGFSKVKYHTLMHSPILAIQETTIEDWWQDPSRYIPIFRLNRFGHPTQPFNIQWVDGLSTIEQTLEQHGWKIIHSKTDVQTVLGRFASYKPEHHLPLFPWLHRSKPPVLFMIKHLPHATTIVELRLWESGVRFEDATLPLWIGSINYHLAPKHLITLHRPHEITWLNGGGINQLIPALSGYQWRKLQIHPPGKSKKIHRLPDWNGTLLLIRSQEGGIYTILLKIN
ncbi:bifunctional DedA family/phosphatase PAP2 family protein [Candidatus Coxiella mudrowiae]|uniref:Phosphatase n=1 Tax=Candidatus Coxiella mudrowiae TaxID=2054173 RepID=A0ABN4HQ16_9COXI|nr:bifunctional DedA family/phosphatase PAP2 family protein [Candidatus Coxiella mudrowiae]AKQ33800.1 Phosphatase [Candidatus Coxiella mudrowiae]